jgi:hypothetical protein
VWPNTVNDKNITDEQMAMLDAREGKIFLVSDPTRSVTHAQVAASLSEPVIGRGVRWDPIFRKDALNARRAGGKQEAGAVCGADWPLIRNREVKLLEAL